MLYIQYKDNRNEFCTILSDAAYKFVDIVIGVAKFYLYTPNQRIRNEMRRGVRGIAEEERPELSPHYEASKRNFKGRINFCAQCKDGRCAVNRYECHRYAATAEFLETIERDRSDGSPVFSFHDFYGTDKIEYFLQNFTVPVEDYANQTNEKPNGLENTFRNSIHYRI